MANFAISRDEKGDRIIREDDIYQWFVENEKHCGYRTDPFVFVKRVQSNAQFYMNLLKNRCYDENSHSLESLSLLLGSGFKQHFLLLLSAKHLPADLFSHLVNTTTAI